MAANKLNTVNQALVLCGAEPLLGLTDISRERQLADIFWGTSYRASLGAYDWNFAAKVAVLAQLEDPPAGFWDLRYQLPSDFIRIRFISPQPRSEETLRPDQWARYGNEIWTDESDLIMKYTAVVNFGWADAIFEQAMAAQLGFQMSYTLTGSRTKGVDLFGLFLDRTDESAIQNMLERPTEETITGQLIEARN